MFYNCMFKIMKQTLYRYVQNGIGPYTCIVVNVVMSIMITLFLLLIVLLKLFLLTCPPFIASIYFTCNSHVILLYVFHLYTKFNKEVIFLNTGAVYTNNTRQKLRLHKGCLLYTSRCV